jgi:hypothetical protein
MQVVHTAGAPPRSGSTIFANIGWTRKSRKALTNSAVANSGSYDLLVGSSHMVQGAGFQVPGAGSRTSNQDREPEPWTRHLEPGTLPQRQ